MIFTGETPRRGRPRRQRSIDDTAPLRCFSPQCFPDEEGMAVTLLPEEVELIRLIDLEGLEQEEAAMVLGVSRRTVWRDLHAARKKVAAALTTGKGIRIDGCSRAAHGVCPKDCPRFPRII